MRVHDQHVERRGDLLKLYEYTVFSDALGLRGKCDCIEARRWEQGCRIRAADFPVRLYPIEYKHGAVRQESSYMIQLCAQAMCLEEMLCCTIDEGALFYGEVRRRTSVSFTDNLRCQVQAMLEEMHQLDQRGYTPKVKPSKSCNACSLKELCLPALMRGKDAGSYLRQAMEEF